MYICICNAIREKDLRRAACEQAGDAESLYARLGFAPQCHHHDTRGGHIQAVHEQGLWVLLLYPAQQTVGQMGTAAGVGQ